VSEKNFFKGEREVVRRATCVAQEKQPRSRRVVQRGILLGVVAQIGGGDSNRRQDPKRCNDPQKKRKLGKQSAEVTQVSPN
jgi:hypothetical protein